MSGASTRRRWLAAIALAALLPGAAASRALAQQAIIPPAQTIEGPYEVDGSLRIQGLLTVRGAVRVAGAIMVKFGRQNIRGELSERDPDAPKRGRAAPLTIKGPLTVDGPLIVHGSLTVDGLDIYGPVTIGGDYLEL